MVQTAKSPFPFPPRRVYRGANIPMLVIRRYARAVAEEFRPDKIVLFGSYAYGTPHEDSDVDLLVVMPARNQLDQAVQIRWRLAAAFAWRKFIGTRHTALAEKNSSSNFPSLMRHEKSYQ